MTVAGQGTRAIHQGQAVIDEVRRDREDLRGF